MKVIFHNQIEGFLHKKYFCTDSSVTIYPSSHGISVKFYIDLYVFHVE